MTETRARPGMEKPLAEPSQVAALRQFIASFGEPTPAMRALMAEYEARVVNAIKPLSDNRPAPRGWASLENV
jgi:hypothetical protein